MRDYGSVAKSLRCCISDSEPCEYCNCELEECTPKTIMEIAADAIEELLARVPDTNVGKWISVEDSLPEDWKPVLAYDPIGYGEIGIAFIIGSLNTVVWRGVGFTNTAYPPSVTHWMPLPEPPKEENKR